MQLDKQPYQVAVDRKKAALDVARAKLVQAQATTRATAAMARALRFQMLNAMQQVRGDIQQLQGDVATLRKYRANLENADKEYRRVLRLREGESVSREDIDTRRAAFLAADAEVRAARENIRKTRAALNLLIEPPEGKELGYVPADLEQDHPTVRAALSQMIQTGAQLGLNSPRDRYAAESAGEPASPRPDDEFRTSSTTSSTTRRPSRWPRATWSRPARIWNRATRSQLHRHRCRNRWRGDAPQRQSRQQCLGGTKPDGRPLAHGDLDRRQLQGNAISRPVYRAALRCEVDMYGSRREYDVAITGFTMGTGKPSHCCRRRTLPAIS